MVKKSILAKVGDVIDYKLIRDGYKTGKGNVVVTAEMDTKTVITADVPSTAYTSNLDYEVDISGENPPVINIKNDITCPDDTVISKGKYLFYDIGQEYNVKNTNWKPEFAEPNGYTIVGSPTISSEFIMTNFDNSNYISTPNLDYSSPFILEMHLKFSNYTSGWVFKSSVDYSLDTYFGNSMIIAIGNGSNYHDMAITPSLPFDGKMILKWDGNTYTYTAIDEVSDTTYGPVTYSSSQVIPSSPMKIGYKNCDYIDLKKFIFTSSDSSKSYRAIKDESIINIPGIKDFTLNDNGTELTTKLFDYHYNIPSTYKYNVFKNGDVIIDDNQVASNLTTSDYLTTKNVNFGTSDYEVVIKFLYNKKSSDYSVMFVGDNDSMPHVNVATTASSSGYFYLHSNVYDGSWGEGITGTHQLQLNQIYTVKVERKNNIRKTYVLINDNWVEDGSIEDNHSYSGIYRMGTTSSSQSFTNSKIYLKDSYIKIGNENKQYFAYYSPKENKSEFIIDSSKPTSIPNISMSYSEFIDNITIPAHALFEYVNGEWKLSGTAQVITQDVTVNADNAEITMKEIEE